MYKMEDRTTIQISEKLRRELRVLASKRDCSYQQLIEEMVSVFKELEPGRSIVTIPKRLADKLRVMLKDTEFQSISEWLTFVVRLLLYEEFSGDIKTKDLKRVKQKLMALGYLK